jgi:hypothetical protein
MVRSNAGAGIGRAGIVKFVNPASAISLLGAGAGLKTATSWPRSASARAMGMKNPIGDEIARI